MPERKTLRTCANIVLAISLVMISFGFLGIKINQTKAPVPSSFLIDLCKKVGTPITIIGAVLLVAAIIAGNTTMQRRTKLFDYFPYLLIIPAVAFLVVFVVYPMFNVIYLSLFNGTVMNPTKSWMGINNFKMIFVVKRDFITSLKNTAVYTAADKSQSFKMNGRTYYQGLVFSGGASYNETNASLFTVNTENVSRLRFTAGHIDNAARKNATVKIYRDNVHDEAEDIVLTPDMALKEYELDVSDTKCLLLWIDRGGDSVYAFGDISVNEKECGLKSAAPVYASPEKMLNASFNNENITVCSATDQSQSFKMNGRTYYQGIQFNGGMPYYDPNTSRISFNTENVSRLSFTAGHLDNTALKDATLYIYRDNVKSDEETIGLSASMPLKDYVIDVTDTGVLTLVMERKTKSDSSVSISGYGFANVSFDGRQAELECKIPKYTDTAQLLKAGFNTQKAAVYSGDDTSRTFTVGSETYSQGIVFGGGNFYTPQTENRISFNVENTGAVTMKLGCVQSTDGKEDSVMRVMLDNQEIRQIPLKKDMPVRDYTFNTAGSAVLELVVPVSYTDSYAAADIRLSDTPVILRGDVNGNGEVGVDDAQIALRAYTERLSGKPLPLNKAQTEAADVDDSGIISIEDVQLILKYYTENTVAGKKVSWEALIQ